MEGKGKEMKALSNDECSVCSSDQS